MAEVTALGHRVMEGIARSLDLPADYFARRYTADPLILFRIFNYPSRPIPAGLDVRHGVGEHTDYGLLTLLRQDDVGGLQVHTRQGWIEAPPVPDSFVCNIGDMLDRMTGGLYRSTPHRVRLNTSGRDRLSFPLFFDPDFDARIEPIRSAATDDHATRWDGASVHAFEGTLRRLPARQGRQGVPGAAARSPSVAGMGKLEHTLAEFVTGLRLQSVPADAQRIVRRMVLAVAGTGFAGAAEDGVARAARAAASKPAARRRRRPWSSATGCRPHAAAQLNGTMCRALDFCDAMAPGPHIGSALFPAALAAAELAGGCTGEEFMAALVAGAELSSRFNLSEAQYDGFDPDRHRRRVLGGGRRIAHPRADAGADAACAGAGVQPLRRQLPEPRRRLARRAHRAGLGGGGRRAVRADGAARRHRAGELPDGHYGYAHLYGRGTPRSGVGGARPGRDVEAAARRLQEVPELRRHAGRDRAGARRWWRSWACAPTDVRSAEVRLPPYAHRLVGHAVPDRRQPARRCAVQRRLLRRQCARAAVFAAASISRRRRCTTRRCAR